MTAPDSPADRSPYIAWGLRATTLALKAKTGARVPVTDVIDLAASWRALLDDDTAAGAAVARFLAELQRDAHAAGEGLLVFLDGWRGGRIGAHGRQAEAILADVTAELAAMPGQPAPAWTRRADCGLD